MLHCLTSWNLIGYLSFGPRPVDTCEHLNEHSHFVVVHVVGVTHCQQGTPSGSRQLQAPTPCGMTATALWQCTNWSWGCTHVVKWLLRRFCRCGVDAVTAVFPNRVAQVSSSGVSNGVASLRQYDGLKACKWLPGAATSSRLTQWYRTQCAGLRQAAEPGPHLQRRAAIVSSSYQHQGDEKPQVLC